MAARNVPSTRLDVAKWRESARTLKTEGESCHGLLNVAGETSNHIQKFLTQINGVLTKNTETNLIELLLIRDDYVKSTLPLIDEDNSGIPIDMGRQSRKDGINQIRCNYINILNNYKESVAFANDTSIIFNGHRKRTHSIESATIGEESVANRFVSRQLRDLTTPVWAGTIPMFTSAAVGLNQGSLFRYTFGPLGIDEVVMRVTRVRFPSPGDPSPYTLVEAVQDIFDARRETAFADAPDVPVVAVDRSPPKITASDRDVFEMSRFMFRLADERFRLTNQALGGDLSNFLVHAVRCPSTVESFDVNYATDFGRGSAQNRVFEIEYENMNCADYGQITADISQSAKPTSITLRNVNIRNSLYNIRDQFSTQAERNAEMESGKNFGKLNDEIISWEVGIVNPDGTITLDGIVREQQDTSVRAHAENDYFYMISHEEITDIVGKRGYAFNPNTPFRHDSVNGFGNTLGDPFNITFTGRTRHHISPKGLTINNFEFPTSITVAQARNLTLNFRRRAADNLLNGVHISPLSTAADQAPESGVSYVVDIYTNGTNTTRGRTITSSNTGTLDLGPLTAGNSIRIELYATGPRGRSRFPQVREFSIS